MPSIFTDQRRAEIVAKADAKADRAQAHWIDGAAEAMSQAEMSMFQKEFTKLQGTGKRMAAVLREMLLGVK